MYQHTQLAHVRGACADSLPYQRHAAVWHRQNTPVCTGNSWLACTDCGKTVIRNPSLRCITVIMACLCRERGRSGSSSGGLGGAGGGGQSELQLQRQRLIARRKALQKKLSEVNNNNVQPSNKCICIAPWSLLEGRGWEASTSMQLPSTSRQLPSTSRQLPPS